MACRRSWDSPEEMFSFFWTLITWWTRLNCTLFAPAAAGTAGKRQHRKTVSSITDRRPAHPDFNKSCVSLTFWPNLHKILSSPCQRALPFIMLILFFSVHKFINQWRGKRQCVFWHNLLQDSPNRVFSMELCFYSYKQPIHCKKNLILYCTIWVNKHLSFSPFNPCQDNHSTYWLNLSRRYLQPVLCTSINCTNATVWILHWHYIK